MTLDICGSLILASSSPRRIEIMRAHGITPVVIPAETDEYIPDCLNVRQAVMFLALKKALWVEKSLYYTPQMHGGMSAQPHRMIDNTGNMINQPVYIIAADTVVYKNGIIGKPEDRDDAVRILNELRATDHLVYTGVAIIKANEKKRRLFYEVTRVFFKDYTETELYNYIDSEEPYDKAGAYAVQGEFGRYIDHIEGDRNNVIGFPWDRFLNEFMVITNDK